MYSCVTARLASPADHIAYCAGAIYEKHTFLASYLHCLRVWCFSRMQQYLHLVHGWLSIETWILKTCSSRFHCWYGCLFIMFCFYKLYSTDWVHVVWLPAFSRPRYEDWLHHEQSFSIDVCLPPSLLVLSMTTQSTILCCLSMSSWVYLEYGSLGFYLVLIPSPGNTLSFSIYAHSIPVSFLSQTQVDLFTRQLSQVPIHQSSWPSTIPLKPA